MASTKEYRDFILEQLSELEEIRCRAMMGEYLLYYRGVIFGEVCQKIDAGRGVGTALRRRQRNATRGQCGQQRVSAGAGGRDV